MLIVALGALEDVCQPHAVVCPGCADGQVISVDIEAQCRSCFKNVRSVLEDAGAAWNDLVDVLVFLTDMERDFETYNRIYAEYFAGEGNPNPTRTTIEINRLPTPIAVEVKAIAHVPAL